MTNQEQADVMIPPPIDSAMREIAAANSAKAGQTTGIKGLSSIEAGNNVMYSSIQAVIKLHTTNLVPYIRTAEKANAQLANIAFMWLQQGDGYTEVGYRTRDTENGNKGDGLTISGSDFDPDDLYISCKIVANSTGDKMQEANFYATLRNAGAHIAWKEVLEQLSLGNGDVLEAEWIDEQALTTALQMKVSTLQAKLQQKVKEQDAQLQMAIAQKQQADVAAAQGQGGEVPPDESNPMIPGGQGMNAAMGGEPTATAMPGATSPVQ